MVTVFRVYGSKYNKESLHYLRYQMRLSEFLEYMEWIDIMEAYEIAANKDDEIRQEQANNKKGR